MLSKLHPMTICDNLLLVKAPFYRAEYLFNDMDTRTKPVKISVAIEDQDGKMDVRHSGQLDISRKPTLTKDEGGLYLVGIPIEEQVNANR